MASPLERQFTTIAGVDEMTSSSSSGSASVTLQFDRSRDVDSAAVDVETAIAAAMPLLPAGMTAPPSFREFNPADSPIMYLGLTSTTVPMSQLDDYAETMIAPRISMVNGHSQVQVQGAQKFAVRVQVAARPRHRSRQGRGGGIARDRHQVGSVRRSRTAVVVDDLRSRVAISFSSSIRSTSSSPRR